MKPYHLLDAEELLFLFARTLARRCAVQSPRLEAPTDGGGAGTAEETWTGLLGLVTGVDRDAIRVYLAHALGSMGTVVQDGERVALEPTDSWVAARLGIALPTVRRLRREARATVAERLCALNLRR